MLITALAANAQTFVKEDNIINQTTTATNYSGAAWIDYDNDGDLDLFATSNYLFVNDGSGSFSLERVELGPRNVTIVSGVSYSDFNNDGVLDFALSGSPISIYLGNESSYTKVEDYPFSQDTIFRGWAPAWGDYNNDGYIDLFVTHAAGFIGPREPSHLFKNNGDGRFTKIEEYEFNMEEAPYTIPTWTDFDLDGDLDLFIGSGPANGTAARDYIYINQLVETGSVGFVRLDEGPLGTDLQDGQTYNTVDFDNDGDLDIHLTNYSSVSDKFYWNNNGTYEHFEGSGLFVEGARLGSNWGDTDNDGDLDVIVTSESGNSFYRNNGDGTFSEVTDNGINAEGQTRGASLGDYDNDGDLDIFISGAGDGRGLFINKNDNNNNWIKFDLEGTVSNRTAIGAKVKIKADINGNEVQQMRELLAQNSFGAHNSFTIHFGLGDASLVSEALIEWPSGQTTEMMNLNANATYSVTEEIPLNFFRANFSADKVSGYGELTVQFSDLSLTDPENPVASWEWDFNNDGTIDATEENPEWNYNDVGMYSVSLTVSNGTETKQVLRENYIEVKTTPGTPIILSGKPESPDTLIGKSGSVDFSVVAQDTTGYELSYKWTRNGAQVAVMPDYPYSSSFIYPTPRTDTVTVTVSNVKNSVSRTWYVEVVDDPTSVEEDGIPTTYALDQNYPNPFNPATKIKYSIPQQSFVSIKVYDILGNQISTLVNENKSPGFYEADWNAESISSGIYFYTIKAGSFVETKKMMLIK